ncbi:MAG: LemA family protein [Candidatus Nanopelagicales bacterium]
MTILIIIAIVIVLVGLGVIMYNRLVRLRNKVEEAWAQIDVQLQRRHDLIPNLVSTVKGYAQHEKSTLEEVTAARAAAVSAQNAVGAGQGAAAAGQTETALTAALGRLFAVAENYPELKADQNFRQLQSELSETEDKVAFARQYYNDNVREWNTRISSVPDNFVANMMGAKKAEYFELEAGAGAAPQVGF